MTNDERLNFLASEIDKLLEAKKQSRILLKKNDYEFLEKRATIWLNRNQNGEVPRMAGFGFSINDKRKVFGVNYKGIQVIDIESVKMAAA